jgi:hypothetical protein
MSETTEGHEVPRVRDDKDRRDDVPSPDLSRRAFIQTVVALSAAAPALASPVRSAPANARRDSVNEGTSISVAVLNRLIPASETMPGAGDLGVGLFLSEILASAPHLHERLSSLFAELRDNETFETRSVTEAEAELRQLEVLYPEAFDLLLQIVYAGYYGHPSIQTALGWTDPSAVGYPSELFDGRLLEGTRQRGLERQDRLAREGYPTGPPAAG